MRQDNLTPMKVADELKEFVNKFDQHELRFVIAYAVGYYGAVDPIVWEGIRHLLSLGVVE